MPNAITEKILELGIEQETAEKLTTLFSDTIKGEYIPMYRFNEVNDKAKTSAAELETLTEKLNAKTTEYDELVEQHESEKAGYTTKIGELENKVAHGEKVYSVKEKLLGKVFNADDVIGKLDLDGEDLDGQIETVKKEYPHYFKNENSGQQFFKNPDAKKGEGNHDNDGNPKFNPFTEFKKSDFSYFSK